MRRPRGNPACVRGAPSLNPSGRPRRLHELEVLIRAEFADTKTLEVLEAMRQAALGVMVLFETVDGDRIYAKPPDAGAAKVFLERVMGPPRIHTDDLEQWETPELEAVACRALQITADELRAVRESRARLLPAVEDGETNA